MSGQKFRCCIMLNSLINPRNGGATFKFDMDYINILFGCSFKREDHKTRRKIIKMFNAIYLDFLTTVNLAYIQTIL